MIKPSDLKNRFPLDSTLQKIECEIVARNIMVILARTGDKFRKLEWEEYRLERIKDANDSANKNTPFSEYEKPYFDAVAYLSKGREEQLVGFSNDWRKVIDLISN